MSDYSRNEFSRWIAPIKNVIGPILCESINGRCSGAVVFRIERGDFRIEIVGEPVYCRCPKLGADSKERCVVDCPTIGVLYFTEPIGDNVHFAWDPCRVYTYIVLCADFEYSDCNVV